MIDFGISLVTSVPQLRLKTILKNRVSIKILNKELPYRGQIHKSSQGDQPKSRDPSG